MKLRALALLAVLICAPDAAIPAALAKPELVIYKASRKAVLYGDGKIIKTFQIGLGLNPVPPKAQEGDRATPEGIYRVCAKVPNSQFYKALVLSYPNLEDANRGLKIGLISKKQFRAISGTIATGQCPPFNTKLGGLIEMHGMGSQSDWTWGCIAFDNPDIEELYALLPIGTLVRINA